MALVATCSCAACSALPPPTLPQPDVDMGLGDVVLLTWTTRSPAGILGHAMTIGEVGVDPHRKVVDGDPVWVDTSQKMRFLFTRERNAGGRVQAMAVRASAGVAQATHIAYEVHLTRYLELPPTSLRYTATSGCCLGGEVSPNCGQWYVIRMMWGSGRVQYLQRVTTSVGVTASELIRAEGGTAYRRLNEISFDKAFFAYEAVPLSDLCAGVPPEDELPTLAVRAPRNCWAWAQRNDGSHAALAWHVADESGCREVVRTYCGKQQPLLSCHATFSSGANASHATIPLQEPAPPVVSGTGTGTTGEAETAKTPPRSEADSDKLSPTSNRATGFGKTQPDPLPPR